MGYANTQIQLQKGRNFLRMIRDHSQAEQNIYNIIPHDEVYDGYEITLLIESDGVPSASFIEIINYSDAGYTYDGNIALMWDPFAGYMSGINPSPAKLVRAIVGTTDVNHFNQYPKIFKFIWDAKNNLWLETSRIAIRTII